MAAISKITIVLLNNRCCFKTHKKVVTPLPHVCLFCFSIWRRVLAGKKECINSNTNKVWNVSFLWRTFGFDYLSTNDRLKCNNIIKIPKKSCKDFRIFPIYRFLACFYTTKKVKNLLGCRKLVLGFGSFFKDCCWLQ